MAQLISHTIPEAYSSTRARTADRGCSPNDSYHGCLPLVKVAKDGYIDMLKIPNSRPRRQTICCGGASGTTDHRLLIPEPQVDAPVLRSSFTEELMVIGIQLLNVQSW